MGLLDQLFSPHDDGTYADEQTLFGRAQVYDMEDDAGRTIRALDIDGTWQSASYVDEGWWEPVFAYHELFGRALYALPQARRALLLGGGALGFPKYALVTWPDLHLDAVEADPAVIRLAQRWFFLERLTPQQRARLHVHEQDALDFVGMQAVRAADDEGLRYDLVANDLFCAETPNAELMSAEGVARVKALLAPGGIYATNVVSAIRGRKARPLRMVQDALEQTFAQVVTVSLGEDEPRVPDNNVVFASDATFSLADIPH